MLFLLTSLCVLLKSDGGFRKCIIGKKVLSCIHLTYNSNPSSLPPSSLPLSNVGVFIELLLPLRDETTEESNPPMGPGLTNGYPIELTCSTLVRTDLRLDQFAVCGVRNTNAGAFGLLQLENRKQQKSNRLFY